jgi:hypothetical protein
MLKDYNTSARRMVRPALLLVTQVRDRTAAPQRRLNHHQSRHSRGCFVRFRPRAGRIPT